MPKINIIIPCYNSHKTIDRCIGSIVMQVGSDYNITLVNDGEISYEEVINRYSSIVDIKEISYGENKGPGFARNYGLKNTSGDYIVFIDSDDALYNAFSLQIMEHEIKNGDYLISGILQEQKDNTFKIKKNNANYTHGKMYKRSFLEENNILFKESSCCEDAGFNALCSFLAHNISKTDLITYSWMYNNNSLGRKDALTWERKIVPAGYVDNIIYAFNEADKRNLDTLFLKVSFFIKIAVMYYTNVDAAPQFKKENFYALRNYYETICRPIDNKITHKLFDAAYDSMKIENREQNLKVLKELMCTLKSLN